MSEGAQVVADPHHGLTAHEVVLLLQTDRHDWSSTARTPCRYRPVPVWSSASCASSTIR